MIFPKLRGSRWTIVLAIPLVLWLCASAFVAPAARLARAQSPAADTSTLRALQRERLATLREIAAVETDAYNRSRSRGERSFEPLARAEADVLSAALELCDTEANRITLLEATVAKAKVYEDEASTLAKAGAETEFAVLKRRSHRLQAEIALERARSSLKLPQAK